MRVALCLLAIIGVSRLLADQSKHDLGNSQHNNTHLGLIAPLNRLSHGRRLHARTHTATTAASHLPRRAVTPQKGVAHAVIIGTKLNNTHHAHPTTGPRSLKRTATTRRPATINKDRKKAAKQTHISTPRSHPVNGFRSRSSTARPHRATTSKNGRAIGAASVIATPHVRKAPHLTTTRPRRVVPSPSVKPPAAGKRAAGVKTQTSRPHRATRTTRATTKAAIVAAAKGKKPAARSATLSVHKATTLRSRRVTPKHGKAATRVPARVTSTPRSKPKSKPKLAAGSRRPSGAVAKAGTKPKVGSKPRRAEGDEEEGDGEEGDGDEGDGDGDTGDTDGGDGDTGDGDTDGGDGDTGDGDAGDGDTGDGDTGDGDTGDGDTGDGDTGDGDTGDGDTGDGDIGDGDDGNGSDGDDGSQDGNDGDDGGIDDGDDGGIDDGDDGGIDDGDDGGIDDGDDGGFDGDDDDDDGIVPEPIGGDGDDDDDEETTTTSPEEDTTTADPRGTDNACGYNGQLSALQRHYHGGARDHLYTVDGIESVHLRDATGYSREPDMGFIGLGEDTTCKELTPLWRFYYADKYDHFLTASNVERNAVAARSGFVLEQSPMGYCVKKPSCGADVPLYRFYSTQTADHLYTTESKEADVLRQPNSSWLFEGIECYVWSTASGKAEC